MQRYLLPLFLLLQNGIFAQDIDYARHVVATLASPECKGRGYVEKGSTLAAAFIENEFKTIGLMPFTGGYFQPFTITANVFPSRTDVIIDDRRLVPGKDFLIDPSSPSINGTFDIILIKKSDLLSEKSLAELVNSAWGKIIAIDERGYKTENKDELKKAESIIQLLKYGSDVKNTGTLLITDQKLSWNVSAAQSDRPNITAGPDINIQQGSKITLKIDARLIQYKTGNVAAYVPGTAIPDSFLVCIAHYDHLGMMGKEALFPGANDNASGVAMMLSLARYFQARPQKYSMAFIALGAEEAGVIGARYFVDHPLIDLARIRFLVNFDLAGTGEEGIKVVNGSVYPEKFNLLKNLNDSNQYLKSVQVRGPACNSDHCMFHEKKVPCFYIYTLGGIQSYHDIYDCAETLPLTEFVDYCRLMTSFFENIQ